MSALADLFPGLAEARIATQDAEIYVRHGGEGPALVLVHGYPQSHAMWHRLAGELAQDFTVVLPDLRGYGRSTGPGSDPEHIGYAKRTMGADIRTVMRALGHDRFMLAGHDRGGRVAYRLALDSPETVSRLVLLDIVPTTETWAAMDARAAIATYHWLFLAQPEPMPETLMAGAHEAYIDYTLADWTASGDLSAFHPAALADYRALLASPQGRRAVCEDYRAGATYDWQADDDDRAADRRITCPTLVLWGTGFLGRATGEAPLAKWQSWCTDVRGEAIEAGHFIAEENPDATLAAMKGFLLASS